MRVPRDVSGSELIRALGRVGYEVIRQTGSHVRLRSTVAGREHNITLPNHDPIKIGTLNGILGDVAAYLRIGKLELVQRLFGR